MARKQMIPFVLAFVVLQVIIILGLSVGEKKSEAQGRCVNFRLQQCGGGVLSGYRGVGPYGLKNPIRLCIVQS
ncbi:MAG: hypothetical protein KAR05_00300 [Candidatus Omnitrophica bacterium]|nr:hypothetical protein [Candidatus Omnitrophota bacterium]